MVNLAQRVFDDSTTWEGTERDLSFHPANPATPRRLSQEQIHFYNKQGYVKGISIFSATEIAGHRSYFDRLLDKQLRDGGDSYSLRRLTRFCQPVWDIVTNPLILDYVEDIPDPTSSHGEHSISANCREMERSSHGIKTARTGPLTPAHTVTLWLAVDDADSENGCMQVLPATHTLGILDFDMSGADENSVLPQKIKRAEDYGTPVPFELKAGEISLHADMLVHGSDINRSNRRRCGLTVRYAASSVRSIDEGWTQNSIVCRGKNPTSHWANVPRPERDILDEVE